LAKRKRKKKSIGTQLKYEVYGILLITASVIAMSGEAAVGRSLSKLFGLLLGKFYFVLPLVGIYIGLAVMIKRAWPRGWSNRKTGVILLVLALTLMSAISEIDRKLGPTGLPITSGTIMSQLSSDIRGDLLFPAQPEQGMLDKAISGGYAGAIQYSILFGLFGYFGAKFVMIVMFAIAVMLLTGRSYVDLARLVKTRGGRLLKLLRYKLGGAGAKPAASLASAAPAGRPKEEPDIPLMILDDDDELEDDDLPYAPPAPGQRKKSLFFSWLQPAKRSEPASQPTPDPKTGDDGSEDDGLPPIVGIESWHQEEPKSDESPPWEEEPNPSPRMEWPEALAPVDALPLDERIGEEEISPAAGGSAAGGTSAVAGMPASVVAGTPAAGGANDPKPSKPYLLPPFSLLAKPQGGKTGTGDSSEAKRKLEATLESFGVKATVLDVVRGPAVTRYEVQPATGVKVSRIVSLTDDIALALAAKDIRMEAPIPGKSAIGIEVPNTEVSMVTMREVMETPAFQQAPSKLSIAFGRDISGQPIVGNLARMPHLLVAGATGSGKSVCINGIITSILYKAAPDEVKFMMIDPKMVELNVYNGIPHLLAPVVTDPRRASLALKKIVVEMEKRYELFSKSGTRNIEGYNTLQKDNPAAVLPYIVVIVDELADLMMVAANDVEDAITRLAQMARAAGIHLIIATQRPSVDVITGVIKANIPSRIAFGVSSQVDSRTILDMVGAEKLLGRGDMLFLPVGMSKPIRVQGAFLSDQEVETVVNFARDQAQAEYKEDLVPEIEESGPEDHDQLDELFDQAVSIIVEAKQASVSLLQRRMRIGYTRAARLIDQMEARGIVGPYEGSKPREVLMSPEQLQAGKISS